MLCSLINKNGGGGENRTRVQSNREVSILQACFEIDPVTIAGPLGKARTATRVRDYVLAWASNH